MILMSLIPLVFKGSIFFELQKIHGSVKIEIEITLPFILDSVHNSSLLILFSKNLLVKLIIFVYTFS